MRLIGGYVRMIDVTSKLLHRLRMHTLKYFIRRLEQYLKIHILVKKIQ